MEFVRSTNVPNFKPWIGINYGVKLRANQSNEPVWGVLDRTHIMGESHYSDEEPHPNFTINAVESCALEQNKYGNFWTQAIQVVERKEAWKIDRRAAWENVAYSNFIQDVLPGSRVAPDDAMWERARQSFFGQLAITKPAVLVVLGKRNFANLPNDGMRIPWALAVREEWEPVTDAWLYGYEVNDVRHLTIAVSVSHPSGRGFNWDIASQRVWSAISFYSNVVCAFEDGSLS